MLDNTLKNTVQSVAEDTVNSAVGDNTLNALFVGQSNADKLFTAYSGAGDTAFKNEAGGYYDTVNTINGATSGTAAKQEADGGSGYWWLDVGGKGNAYTTMESAVTASGIASSAINAIFWVQGERDASVLDAIDLQTSASYTEAEFKAATLAVLTQMKSDFPNAKIILVPLGADTNGNEHVGWTYARRAHYELWNENSWICEGPAHYDLSLFDDLHHDQTGYETMGERLARRIAALHGKRTSVGTLGAEIISVSFAGGTNDMLVNIQHDAGTDITGTDKRGWNCIDDGTQTGVTSVARSDATTIDVQQGSVLVAGSVIQLLWPFGTMKSTVPSGVITDNATNAMPIRPYYSGTAATET